MIENFLKKKYVVPTIITIIMLGAFFVRFYHFHDWLYFKMDQARDAFTISNAVLNGPGNLPLLGARAGATKVTYGFLNLGPIFYYFQYASGVLFHSIDPAVFAYPDLFFGVAVLPLLYLFCRNYFQRLHALLIVLMYAFSYLVIEYSRFAWNPNSLPFFTILSFLALLKALNPRKEKDRKWWIILWAAGLSVGSQLHFVGFFSLVGVSGLLVIYHFKLWKLVEIKNIFKRSIFKKIGFYGFLALVVFVFFYTPVILSDSMKNWENSKNFIEALSSKPSDNTFLEKFTKNVVQETRYYTLVTTAYLYSPTKVSASESLPIIFTLAIFLGGMYLAVRKIRTLEDQSRKDFLMLILFWFLVYFILCIPLAYSIRPRFFIFTFALPFIFAGLIMEYVSNSSLKYKQFIPWALTLFIVGGNVWGTYLWFGEQSSSQEKHSTITRTLILKNKDGVTLGQLEGAADFILAKNTGDKRVYFYVKSEHVRSIKYLLFEKNPQLTVNQLKMNGDPDAQYFAIVPTDYKPTDILKKVGQEYKLISEEQLGQIKILEIDFPGRAIAPDFAPDQSQGDSGPGRRLFWRDVFGGGVSTPDYGAESPQDIQTSIEEDNGD